MKVSALDEIAFNHLFDGNVQMAQFLWEKKKDVSSLQNRIVLALIENKYSSAMEYAQVLYSEYPNQFVKHILGEEIEVQTPLWQTFLDSLIDSGMTDLASFNTNIEWLRYIGNKVVGPLVDSISKQIEIAKTSRDKAAKERLIAGQGLMASTRKSLKQLKASLPSSDIRLQKISDKLANEILQCGIDYYNNSEDDSRPEKSLELQKYAFEIAEGILVKQRCKENMDILQKNIDSMPAAIIREEYRKVEEKLIEYNQYGYRISNAISVMNSCRPHLQKIKELVNVYNPFYLKISTAVASYSLNCIIIEVNSHYKSYIDNEDFKKVLQEAWKAIQKIEILDIEQSFKYERYDPNRKKLYDLFEEIGITRIQNEPPHINISPLPSIRKGNSTSNTSDRNNPKSGNDTDELGCTAYCIIIFVCFMFGLGVSGISGGIIGAILGFIVCLLFAHASNK